MPRTRRFPARIGLAALTVATAVAAAVAPAVVTPAASPAAAVASPAVLQAGMDFASNTWQDPWDMSNAADLNLDPGFGTARVTSAKMSGGVATLTFNGVGFATFLRPGYPGTIAYGRDAYIAGNQLSAAAFTRLHLHVAASAAVGGRILWGDTRGGSGFIYINLNQGWNDLDIDLTGPHTGSAWAGWIMALRMDIVARTATTVTLDYVRVYRPSAAGVLSWSAPASTPLLWSDGSGVPTTSATQHGGPVPGAVADGGPMQTDLSAFPPGSVFYVAGSSTPIATTAREPLPVIDSPSAAGCGDYAVQALGHPWTFSSVRSLAGMFNMTHVGFTPSHALVATNAGPQRNDPHVLLPIGRGGIDGRTWHRLTIVESYVGAFNLANAPGGGTVARVFWQAAGQRTFALTNDIVTPTGTQTIVMDMAMRTSSLVESSAPAAQQYPFASTSRVTALRWDPNEDPGARTWVLTSVRLAGDCATRGAATASWHDTSYTPGSTATVLVYGTGTHLITTVPERAGENTVQIPHLPRGRYTVRITVHTPQGASHRTDSTGPLVVTA